MLFRSQLQEIDLRIYALREEKDVTRPAELESLKNELEKRKQALLVFEEKYKKVQLIKKEKEINLASKEEGLRKAQGDLYQLKTNKEYQAKLSEIASLKADISIFEEEIIKILDELEIIKKELNMQKEVFVQEEKNISNKETIIRSQIEQIGIDIKNLEDKRKISIDGVDKKLLATYEQLLKKRSGLAVVPVRENNCGACHLLLNPQKINEIKMYEKMVFCENCVRMLYIPEDIQC